MSNLLMLGLDIDHILDGKEFHVCSLLEKRSV